MGVTVKYSGPLFDGTADDEMDKITQEINEAVAQEGFDMVRTELRSVLRNPTGHYESRVQVDRSTKDVAVTDGGVIYGPWLEGVSSRNSRSRFKGYSTFRKVAQRLGQRSTEIAERVISERIGRLN